MNHSNKFSQANKQIKPEEVAGENNRISLPCPSKKITKENFSKSTKIQSALDSNECLEEIVEALVHRRSQINPDSQDVIDSELLSFLSRN